MATGSTSPLADTAAEQEPESVPKKQKLSSDEKVSFVIPSGDVFQISRAALSCEPLEDGLLRRMVESGMATERNANGAIKLGFECSPDAFQRVVDEYEWALQQAHNIWLGFTPSEHVPGECGPALRVPINPCELHALCEFLGLPSDRLLGCSSRVYFGSPLPVAAAQRALNQAWMLAPQVECFFRALEATINSVAMVTYPTSKMPARISFAITDFASISLDDDFTDDLFYLLQDEEALAELVRVFLPDQAHRFTGIKLRPFNDGSDDDRLCVHQAKRLLNMVPSSLDMASKPVGWFAVAMPAYKLFDGGGHFISRKVPLTLDNLNCTITVTIHYVNRDKPNDYPLLAFKYRLDDVNTQSRQALPLIIKLCDVDDDILCEDAVQRHQAVRSFFFSDAAKPIPKSDTPGSILTSKKLIPLEDILATDEKYKWQDALTAIEAERATVRRPWLDTAATAGFDMIYDLKPRDDGDEGLHLGLNRNEVMAHAEQDRKAAKESKDGLGAADATRFLTFVFNVTETLGMPRLSGAPTVRPRSRPHRHPKSRGPT